MDYEANDRAAFWLAIIIITITIALWAWLLGTLSYRRLTKKKRFLRAWANRRIVDNPHKYSIQRREDITKNGHLPRIQHWHPRLE